MMYSIDFFYSIGESVRVKAIEMMGRVDAMMCDSSGNQYRVVYWNDGQRYAVWMYDWELER